MSYEWDDQKDELNRLKHKISFELAKSVFADPAALVEVDLEHSDLEMRQKIVGRCADGRIITVIFTKRGSLVRLISAQQRRKEKRVYENQDSKPKK